MKIKTIILCVLLLTTPLFSQTTPFNLTLQMRLGNSEIGYLEGEENITVGFYHPASNIALWEESFPSIIFINGYFSIDLGKDENNPIDPDIFYDQVPKIGLVIANEAYDDPVYANLNSSIYSVQSYQTERAYDFFDAAFFHMDHVTKNLGIHVTYNINERIQVSGNIKATNFIGDGSLITNLSYYYWTKLTNPDKTYYDQGKVSIGTTTPISDLTVVGDVKVSTNINITERIIADNYSGDSSLIEGFNASNISPNVVSSSFIDGQYPLISGLGTITSGTWQSDNSIDDSYISDNLNLENAVLSGTNNISGTLFANDSLNIGSSSFLLNIESSNWNIDNEGGLNIAKLEEDNFRIENRDINITNNTWIKFTDDALNGLTLLNDGKLGINTDSPQEKTEINGVIRIGNDDQNINGLIRWTGTDFQVYKDTQWYSLTALGGWNGNTLDSADGDPIDVLYIDNDGKTAIQKTSPQEILDVSGNIVFQGNNSLETLSISGAGTRFIWYPLKASLRAGIVSGTGSNYWDDASIGDYTFAFGENTEIIGSLSSIRGGKGNIVHGQTSSILGGQNNNINADNAAIGGGMGNLVQDQYTGISGGLNNHILNSAYSVILGGELNIIGSGSHIYIANGRQSEASGHYSFIAGPDGGDSNQEGCFIWGGYSASTTKQFLINASGGVGINTNSPSEQLEVNGDVKADYFIGDGSGIALVVDSRLFGGHDISLSFIEDQVFYISNAQGYLPSGTIDTGSILDLTILAEDLNTASVTEAKIANLAIENNHILNFSVNRHNFAPSSIDTFNIVDGAVTNKKMAINAVTSSKIQPGILENQHFATGSVDTDSILDNEITSDKFSTDVLGSLTFIDGSIITSHIANNAITTDKISANAVTMDKIGGIIQVPKGGTGIDSFQDGAIIFAKEEAPTISLTDDPGNLFWDNTNKRVGIKTNPLTYTLEVDGVIQAIGTANGVIASANGAYGFASAGTGVYGYGTDIGVYGTNSPSGFGIYGYTEGSGTAVKGITQEAVSTAYATQGILWINSPSGVAANGLLGYFSTVFNNIASVYGFPGNHNTTNTFAGYFAGKVSIGDSSPDAVGQTSIMQIKGSNSLDTRAALNVVDSTESSLLYLRNDVRVGIATTNPTHELDINGDALFEGIVSFTQQEIIVSPGDTIKTINWAEGNKARLNLDTTNTVTLSFTNPSQSTNLTLLINHQNTGQLTWPANIKWHKGLTPGLTNSVDAIDIVCLYYEQDTNTYYGGARYDFQ